MPTWIIRCGWLLVAATLGNQSIAQQTRVEMSLKESVSRGVRFLQSGQQRDGSWLFRGHNVGITALAGLALLEGGLSATDPQLSHAHDYILKDATATDQTYDISVILLFLDRYGSKEDTQLMLKLGERLVAGQLVSGGWTYVCSQSAGSTGTSGQSPAPFTIEADIANNANTQFAVLGLWAARRAGLDVREAMNRVQQRFQATQDRGGRWHYRPGVKLTTDAMTCAGLVSLLMAKTSQSDHERKPLQSDSASEADLRTIPHDEFIDRALRRVARIRMESDSSMHLTWSIGLVGHALRSAQLGSLPWHERGTTILLRRQNRDGGWNHSKPIPPSSRTADTAFAILFLQQSNLTRGVASLQRTPIEYGSE